MLYQANILPLSVPLPRLGTAMTDSSTDELERYRFAAASTALILTPISARSQYTTRRRVALCSNALLHRRGCSARSFLAGVVQDQNISFALNTCCLALISLVTAAFISLHVVMPFLLSFYASAVCGMYAGYLRTMRLS